MILLIQSYDVTDQARRVELEMCLKNNVEIFSQIDQLPGRKKRWSYGEIMKLCSESYYGEKCVIANSDILFEDDSISEVIEPESLVALTRWESHASPRLLGRVYDDRLFSGTQDVWGFIGGMIPEIGHEILLGTVGCDQTIVGEAVRAGVRVVNPCLTVRTFHLHADTSRPHNRRQSFGLYGYPEVVTAEAESPAVLLHEWPNAKGEFQYEWALHEQLHDH